MWSSLAFAQSPKYFGNVNKDEFEMRYFKDDSSASAVVLFDVGNSEFFEVDYGYNISFRRHRRIKVFDKNKYGNQEVTIPFYQDGFGKSEKVVSIEAHTLNKENGVIKKSHVLPVAIFEEKINENWSIMKFVFPNVQDGSILEYRYELETPFKSKMPNWTFQSDIPTIYSEYMVSLIPFYEYVYYVQGVDEFNEVDQYASNSTRTWGKINKSYGQNVRNGFEFKDVVHKFVLKDVPAFKDESYISSVNNHIIKMYFQLAFFYHPSSGKEEIISTWPNLNKSLLDHKKFGKYIRSASSKTKEILKELNVSQLSESDRAHAIIEYVKKNFEWNNINAKYASQSPKDLIKSHVGNSADINLFMIALLQTANIKCEPVILSTRDHGIIRGEYPFDFFTNYVVGLVGEESTFLADATDDFLPVDRIPPRCLNDKALIVRKGEEAWISLDFDMPSAKKYVIELTPQPDKSYVDYSVTLQTTEYEAYVFRKEFEDEASEIENQFKSNLESISSFKSLFYENFNRPYVLFFEGNFDIMKIGSTLILKPFLNLPIKENKLSQSKRSYPVDFIYRQNTEFETKLHIPKGYKISNVPQNYNIDNPLIKISLSFVIEENSISVLGKYNFKQAIYHSEEYNSIKESINIIVNKFNEEIVLDKVN